MVARQLNAPIQQISTKLILLISVRCVSENSTKKRSKLIEVLFRKFSIDPHGECVVPDDGKNRKKLSWTGFFITDEELPYIVERVMMAYDKT